MNRKPGSLATGMLELTKFAAFALVVFAAIVSVEYWRIPLP